MINGQSYVRSMGSAPRAQRKLSAKSDFGPIRRKRAIKNALNESRFVQTDATALLGVPLNIQHNLGTSDIVVQIWEAGVLVSGNVEIIDDNNIEVTMAANATIKVVVLS